MSQFDFGTIDPNTKSGTALASDLNSFRNALHSSHSGSTQPSYIVAGMMWVDSTSADFEIKLYDGAQSITVAVIDATNNVARVAVDSAETSFITSTTAGQIRHVIASTNIFTTRSTGIQFNLASPVIGDSNNNELVSFTTTASAVNQINVANAATASNPVISAVGTDTNIGITLTPKGTGRTNIGKLALDGTTITTTAAQLNFVAGVTSAIQTQIDTKTALATQAEAEAGTDNAKLMTPLRVAQAIPAKLNAAGSAPLYACRAWVNFNGTGTVAIGASGNVTSVTDNGTGDYTVNFTTALQDADYSIVTSANDLGVVGESSVNVLRTTTAVRLRVVGSGGTSNRDCSEVNVAIFR